MTRAIRCLFIIAIAAGAASAETGFQPLFDGKTLDGWSAIPRKNAEGAWIVEDGALRPTGKPGSLATDAEYGDFDLRLEWKIAKLGNSGVIYRTDEKLTATAIEFQLADNAREASQKYPNRKCGAPYGLYVPSKDVAKPVGEWNTLRIVAKGPHIEHWLNGVKVAAFNLESEGFLGRVAKSKFANEPTFAKARRGKIALQDHASAAWFRNIRIKTQ